MFLLERVSAEALSCRPSSLTGRCVRAGFGSMFPRAKRRFKDGKEYRYWSVVENCPKPDGTVVQRQVCCTWARSTTARGRRGAGRSSCCAAAQTAGPWRFPRPTARRRSWTARVVRIELKALKLRRARQCGACWLALVLWERLDMDQFWRPQLPPSQQGTRWLEVFKTQVCHRLVDPGSKWRLHRHWRGARAIWSRSACPSRASR